MLPEIVESEYVVDPTVSLTPPTRASLWDAERQRRLRILQIINALGAVGAVMVIVVLALLVDESSPIRTRLLLGMVALLALIGVSWMLARTGKLEAGTHVLFGGVVVTMTLVGVLTDGSRSQAPYVLFAPIVGAPLLLSPRWSFGYALLAYVASVLVYVLGPDPFSSADLVFRMVSFAIYYSVVAVLAFQAAQGYARLIQALLGRTRDLEQAQSGLEDRVSERTSALQEALEQLQHSSATIRAMSVPVLPVAAGVLALPLIGTIDHARALSIRDELLTAVHRQRAHTVLIDVTGVHEMDQRVTSAMLEMIQGVRLLGTQSILVGIRADTAQTMAELGLDLNRIVIRRDLQSGLEYALQAPSRRT
jgi:rsbT co-antagonist protein RsbR